MQITDDAVAVRSTVIKARSDNPAVQRLKDRVIAGAQASEVITSYDRMHHRHSRS